jgi:hypothetical protein
MTKPKTAAAKITVVVSRTHVRNPLPASATITSGYSTRVQLKSSVT